jgi:hypothetical protein
VVDGVVSCPRTGSQVLVAVVTEKMLEDQSCDESTTEDVASAIRHIGSLGSTHGASRLMVPTAPRTMVRSEGPTGRESSHGMGEDDRRGSRGEIRVGHSVADFLMVFIGVVSTALGISVEVLEIVTTVGSNFVFSPVVIVVGLIEWRLFLGTIRTRWCMHVWRLGKPKFEKVAH